MKLCRDCKHFVRIGDGMGWCAHPKAQFNLVNGSPTTYCFQARGEISVSHLTICGREGSLFEPKEPTQADHDGVAILLGDMPLPKRPGSILYTEPVERRVSFWKRIFGG